MKTNILLFLVLVSVFRLSAQEINKIVYDEMADENILLGYFDRDALTGEDFNFWYDEEYQSYSVDIKTLENIKPEVLFSLEIKVVMGTWCEDSQREVPRLYKILDKLDFNTENLIMIGVNRLKLADETEVNELNITLVPTIIFYIDDEEIGRIIESPEESLEKDMFKLLSTL
jgi:thiol-disulfide isomerase/thioredoxin